MRIPSLKWRDHQDKPHRGPTPSTFDRSLLNPCHWLHWLALGFLSLFWLVLPARWRDALGRQLGSLMAKGRWPRRIPGNLSRCFKQMSDEQQDAIVLEYCQAQACVVLDLPALWLSSPEQQFRRVNISGLEHLEQEYEAGRPVCLLVCHSLGMEHAARALKWSYPLLGYYQPFGSGVIDWLFYRFRTYNGGYLLRRGDSMRHLVRDLREGWMLYMMIDEDMGEAEGDWVPFFDTEKCAIRAPAKMAAMAQATALPVYSWYNLHERRYEIEILPALENFPSGNSLTDTTHLMQVLQSMIECRPAQYGWRQNLFRSQPGRDSPKTP